VYIYSMLPPCSSEIDDGLSLARQYGGRGYTDEGERFRIHSSHSDDLPLLARNEI